MDKSGFSENAPSGPISSTTLEEKGILINQIKYSYSITKSDKDENTLVIKLFDPSQKSDIFFTYEASMEKLTKEIKFLSICESLDEILDSLTEIFYQGNAFVEEKNGEYDLELKLRDVKKKYAIKLTKHEIEKPKEPKNEFEDKIYKLENKYKELLNKFEELKAIKENITKKDDIKKIIKEVIFDKEIKLKLFEEIEQFFLSKYNLNNIPKEKNENLQNIEKLENNIINKVKNTINDKEVKINNQIINIEKQLKENINYLNNIKSNNYIVLQVEIDKNNLNSNVSLFKQTKVYKYNFNFERDDLETIIDGELVKIKQRCHNGDFQQSLVSNNCYIADYHNYVLDNFYEFYWNFSTAGHIPLKLYLKKNYRVVKIYLKSVFL